MTGPRAPRILITGSRGWTDQDVIERAILQACTDHQWRLADVTVVHGAAAGADRLAGGIAARHGMLVETHPVFRADWRRHGPKAGYLRNQAMVDLGADVCLAFILDGSRGATMCATLAAAAGIPVRRYELRSRV